MTDESAGVAITRDQLRATRLLHAVPDAALAELAQEVVRRQIPSGHELCVEGEEGSSAFLVVQGRFEARAADRRIGEISRGELVGEVSLLTGEPRTATVTALRNSEVLELEPDVFNRVLARHPECYRAVSRQLVERLQRVLTTPNQARKATVITLLHDGSAVGRETVTAVADQLGEGVVVVCDDDQDVAHLEATHDIVVLAPDPGDAPCRRWALGQCDRALLAADATAQPHQLRPLTTDGPVELLLVHPPSTTCPLGTNRWLDVLDLAGHHHVRHGLASDVARVVRHLQREENVLVLSGGGARGLAHAGLWRALHEHDVPIDAIAGVSAGAVAGAVMALGYDHEDGGAVANRLFTEGGGPVDLTIPTIAIASGARMNERLKELCGETRTLEDLWLPLSVVSANLTTSDVHVHTAGSLWRTLRASTAIPGVFPPVAEPFGLLVDGGLVNNLPVELARTRHPGASVIASDVGRKIGLMPDGYPVEAEVGGWAAVRSRLRVQAQAAGDGEDSGPRHRPGGRRGHPGPG